MYLVIASHVLFNHFTSITKQLSSKCLEYNYVNCLTCALSLVVRCFVLLGKYQAHAKHAIDRQHQVDASQVDRVGEVSIKPINKPVCGQTDTVSLFCFNFLACKQHVVL